MAWTLRDAKQERAMIENIDKGDDRSAAVLAGAYLEDRLTLAIKARLTRDIQVHGKFFNGYGPLATFSAKIDLAYLMGILDREARDGFHIIREIRNRFAHRLDLDDFESPMVRDLCKKLFRPQALKIMRDRIREDSEKLAESGQGDPFMFVVGPLADLPDTPRNAYMSTIKCSALMIETGTAFARLDRGEAIEPLVLSLSYASLGKSAPPPPSRPQNEGHAPKKRARQRRASPA